MLYVMRLEGVRFRKYVLENRATGSVVDKRFWTPMGAVLYANRKYNQMIRATNKLGKV